MEGIRASSGGNDILEEYERTQRLTANTRRKLVNVVVNLMIQKYGHQPSSEQKTAHAKAIVELFPKLKDPGSTEGYVRTSFFT